MNPRGLSLAGTLLIFGAAWSLLSILVAESLTPGYSVSSEAISGLGLPYFSGVCGDLANCGTAVQPASAVFVFSLFLSAACSLWAGYLLRNETAHRLFAAGIGVVGIGALLVGLSYIPFYFGVPSQSVVLAAYGVHTTGAVLAFVIGALVAISAYRITKAPFRYVGVVVGAVALVAFTLFVTNQDLGLGFGGMERMILYPVQIWMIAFGSYLLGGSGLDSASTVA